MGSDARYPEQRPAHRCRVEGFWTDRTPMTNAAIARFVAATRYVTLAEPNCRVGIRCIAETGESE